MKLKGFFQSIPGIMAFAFFAVLPLYPVQAEETVAADAAADTAVSEAPPAASSAASIPGLEEDGQGGAYYTIQKGDTLWDLSRKFLNSPWYWPELWKVNTDVPIPNPHLIYPGQRIRLFLKGQLPAPPPPEPMVRVPEMEEPLDVEPLASGETEDLYGDGGRPDFSYSRIDQIGFIRKEPISPSGVIFKCKDDKELISDGDIVFIRKDDPDAILTGKAYTVFRTSNPIKDEKSGETFGIQHLMLGLLEIVKVEEDFALGKIATAYQSIRMDDKIMPYVKREPKIPRVESQPGIAGKIIAAEKHSVMMGEYDIAFIDRGKAAGIVPGQIYSIYEEEIFSSGMKSQGKIIRTPIDFGQIFVLHTEENNSTVMILSSQKSVQPGEKIRTPVVE